MRLIFQLAVLLALIALVGCASAQGDFTGSNIMQRTLQPGEGATLTLLAGDSLTIPAGTFDPETIVIFSDIFTAADGSVTYFPTATKAPEDLLGAVVINTPIDHTFLHDVPLTFDIIEPGESRTTAAVSAGQHYIVYRFNYDTLVWEPWGTTTATVSADGHSATTTLPTTNFTGFIGSLALFEGKLAP